MAGIDTKIGVIMLSTSKCKSYEVNNADVVAHEPNIYVLFFNISCCILLMHMGVYE